jgi:signal transduction histidine kinase
VRDKKSYRHQFVQANGRTLFVNHTAMPHGGFINTFTDISEQRSAEQALQESEKRLRAVIDNVADAIHMWAFSRVDPAEFEPFDPCDSITAAVEHMGQRIALGNIDLTVSLPRDCGEVLGQPRRLKEVAINLLRNALEAVTAHPRAGDGAFIGTIEVSLRAEEDMVRIKVADSGGGIAPEVKEHLFGPFVTGTGLGLSVCHGIVEAMNGKIDTATRLDGTEFTVILPLHKAKRNARLKLRSTGRQ